MTNLQRISIISILTICAALTGCGETAENNTEPAIESTTIVTTTAENKEETTTTTTKTTEMTMDTVTKTEPETTTEDTATAPADETGIITMEDNDNGMYIISECFRRRAEEVTGKKVKEFEYYRDNIPVVLVFEDGNKALLNTPTDSIYEDSLYPIDDFEIISGNSKYECIIEFKPS